MKSNFVFSVLLFDIFFISVLNAQVDTAQIIKDAHNARLEARPVVNLFNTQSDVKKDYITSGYYQLVYEADIAWLEGNDSLAYEKLQAAENTCSLLNQPVYQEMELYTMYLLKNRNFSKAVYYMNKLAAEYGKIPFFILSVLDKNSVLTNNLLMKKLAAEYGMIPFFILSALDKDSVLTNNLLMEFPTFYDSLIPAIKHKCNEFYTQEREELIAELIDISKSDQEVRTEDNLTKKNIYEQMEETDIHNAKRFFEILKKHSFPNTKQCGEKNINSLGNIIAPLVLHISDHYNIEEMILQYIRSGECEPDIYGIIIDRKTIFIRGAKCLYAAYTNTKDSQIEDIDHLDERRMAIGMPTREMERKRNKLFKLKVEANE